MYIKMNILPYCFYPSNITILYLNFFSFWHTAKLTASSKNKYYYSQAPWNSFKTLLLFFLCFFKQRGSNSKGISEYSYTFDEGPAAHQEFIKMLANTSAGKWITKI